MNIYLYVCTYKSTYGVLSQELRVSDEKYPADEKFWKSDHACSENVNSCEMCWAKFREKRHIKTPFATSRHYIHIYIHTDIEHTKQIQAIYMNNEFWKSKIFNEQNG